MPRPFSYLIYFLALAFCFTTIMIGYNLILFNALPAEDGALDAEGIDFLIEAWLFFGPLLSLFVVSMAAFQRWNNGRRYPASVAQPYRLVVDAATWHSFTETGNLRMDGSEISFHHEGDGIYRGLIPANRWASRWIRVVLVPLKEQDGQMVVRIEPSPWMPDYSGFTIRKHHLLAQAFGSKG